MRNGPVGETDMATTPPEIAELAEISRKYRVILSDVWGVIHNGVKAHIPACEALAAARAAGSIVILITNAPRPNTGVEEQFRSLDVPDNCWDRIVTSGDVTRELIAQSARRLFHLGPERDLPIYDGIDVELVEEFEASAVCCTGLFDDDTESPEDYAEMLQRMRSRDLPFICANPDIIVERGDRLIWCAGALARDYGLMGGRTLIAGKPHRPIYEAAIAAATEIAGSSIGENDVLAIGDGMLTDVKGAANAGFDVLYISAGIHAAEYGDADNPDRVRLAAFLQTHGHHPVGFMTRLR